ncbi:MAG: hypothetical protein ACLFWB_10115 [Armatimonadota bacterium]
MSPHFKILAVYLVVALLMVFATWRLEMRPRLVALVFLCVMGLGIVHCLGALYRGPGGARQKESNQSPGRQ